MLGQVSLVRHPITDKLRCLKPGGWIEHMDLSVVFESDDGTVSEDHILHGWGKIFVEAGEKMGKTFEIGKHARKYISEAGFVDVKENTFKLPVGPWSSDQKMKDIGWWNLLIFLGDTEALCLFLLSKVMGVSRLLVFE